MNERLIGYTKKIKTGRINGIALSTGSPEEKVFIGSMERLGPENLP